MRKLTPDQLSKLSEQELDAVLRRHVGARPRLDPDTYAQTFGEIADLKIALRQILNPERPDPLEARQQARAVVYRYWSSHLDTLGRDDSLGREFFEVFDLMAYLYIEAKRAHRARKQDGAQIYETFGSPDPVSQPTDCRD